MCTVDICQKFRLAILGRRNGMPAVELSFQCINFIAFAVAANYKTDRSKTGDHVTRGKFIIDRRCLSSKLVSPPITFSEVMTLILNAVPKGQCKNWSKHLAPVRVTPHSDRESLMLNLMLMLELEKKLYHLMYSFICTRKCASYYNATKK